MKRRRGGEQAAAGSPAVRQRRAVEVSRGSDARVGEILDVAHDLVQSVTPDGRFEYVNPAWLWTLDYSGADVAGLTLWDIVHPDSRTHCEEFFRRILAGTNGHSFEAELVSKDGRTIAVAGSASCQGGKQGVVHRFLRNVTERKPSESALNESKLRLELATQAGRIGAWDWDLKTNEVHFSPEWKQQIGYAEDEISDQYFEWETRLHLEDRDRTLRAVRAYIADPSIGYDVEFRLRHKDGSYRWIATSGMLTFDSQGAPARMLGCHLDVTARKSAELECAAMSKRMELLLQSTGEGIYGIDLNGSCTFINRVALAAIGWRREEVLGRDMHALVHHSRANGSPYPVADCPIVDAFQGKSRRLDTEVFWRRDGSAFEVEYSAHPIVDEGTITGAVVTFSDITEKRKLEAQFRQAHKMEAVGQLAGGVAHDFNNILTVIQGYAEFLNEQFESGDTRLADLAEIRKAAERAARLTRQLLAFSRRQVLQPTILDVNALVTNLSNMLRRIIGEDIDLALNLAADLGRVKADAGQIEQVIANLVVNARDAMPQGGKLTIETVNAELDETFASHHALQELAPGRFLMLSIADSGVGMERETVKHIFEPFFTTKPEGKGTGLGLATVYGIVEQSGGYVWVSSEPGHGTTFKIYLPLVGEGADVQATAPVSTSDLSKPVSVTLMVVEDEEGVRRLAQILLQREGYFVLEADSPAAAISLAKEYSDRIDLLLTDVVMPGGVGSGLYAQLLSQRPDLKVLYMSGYTDDAIIRHGVLEANVAFIQKPFTARALLASVRQVLNAPGQRPLDPQTGAAS